MAKKTVRVQKYFKGEARNTPFAMEESRAKNLVHAHRRAGNETKYKIIDNIDVEPVPSVNGGIQKQIPVVQKKSVEVVPDEPQAGVEYFDLTSVDHHEAIRKVDDFANNLDALRSLMKQENKNKGRKSVLTKLNVLISELTKPKPVNQ